MVTTIPKPSSIESCCFSSLPIHTYDTLLNGHFVMKSNRSAWLLLSPTLLILFLTGFVPFIYVLWVGFFDWNTFSASGVMQYTGVNNFRRLVFDADFLSSLRRTLVFMVTTVSIEMILGFALAGLLNRDFPV